MEIQSILVSHSWLLYNLITRYNKSVQLTCIVNCKQQHAVVIHIRVGQFNKAWHFFFFTDQFAQSLPFVSFKVFLKKQNKKQSYCCRTFFLICFLQIYPTSSGILIITGFCKHNNIPMSYSLFSQQHLFVDFLVKNLQRLRLNIKNNFPRRHINSIYGSPISY